MAELGGAQEPRQPAFLDRGSAGGMRRIVGVLLQADVADLLCGEARLLAVVEPDLAVGAVDVARPDVPVLPDPVPQDGSQRMQRLGISH
jgi:hypothetical protein